MSPHFVLAMALIVFPYELRSVWAERYHVRPEFLGDLYSDDINTHIDAGAVKIESTMVTVKISELDDELIEQVNVEYVFSRSRTSLELTVYVIGENVRLLENERRLNCERFYRPYAELNDAIDIEIEKVFDFYRISDTVPLNKFTFTTSTFESRRLLISYIQPRNNFYQQWTGANGTMVRQGTFHFWINPKLNRRVEFNFTFPKEFKGATFGKTSPPKEVGLSSQSIGFSTDDIELRDQVVICNFTQYLK